MVQIALPWPSIVEFNMSINQSITSTSTGYHMLNRRKVALTIESGALRLHEGGRVVTITRAEALPIWWVGAGRSAPMTPLSGLVLHAPGGAWMVSTMDTTVVLGGAVEQATPAPHVWVNGEDLERMAAACGIEVTLREPWVPPPTSTKSVVLMVLGFVAVAGLFVTLGQFLPSTKGRRSSESCSQQRAPEKELYPRLSCQDARAELDKVARGEATPRAIVLRATSMIVDARDTTGPATITCDGIGFAVIDAKQAADGPINFGDGPHSVLVEEQADGTLRPSQYCACCNVVGRERKGPKPKR
jgi:hypothetical protein